MNPFLKKHNDKELNTLRLIAMAGIGYYLFRAFKKEATLANAFNNPEAAKIKTRAFMSMAQNVVRDYVPPEAKKFFDDPNVSQKINDLGTSVLNTFLGQPNNDDEDDYE